MPQENSRPRMVIYLNDEVKDWWEATARSMGAKPSTYVSMLLTTIANSGTSPLSLLAALHGQQPAVETLQCTTVSQSDQFVDQGVSMRPTEHIHSSTGTPKRKPKSVASTATPPVEEGRLFEDQEAVVEEETPKPRTAPKRSAQFDEARDYWKAKGGRVTTTKTRTYKAWKAALIELNAEEEEPVTEDELLRRVKVAADHTSNPTYLPDLAVALNGSKKGCQFSKDGIEGMEAKEHTGVTRRYTADELNEIDIERDLFVCNATDMFGEECHHVLADALRKYKAYCNENGLPIPPTVEEAREAGKPV